MWSWSYGSCKQWLSPLSCEYNPAHGEVYLIQHYVVKFGSDLQKVGGFLWVLANETDHHDMIEILLKLAFNIIILILTLGMDNRHCNTLLIIRDR